MPKPCPCKSGLPYSQCCGPLHAGKPAPTALALMRARFSAYALHNADYIIKTTHPNNPGFIQDHKRWKQEILAFCENTSFDNLVILEDSESKNSATVVFIARLSQNGKDASFWEKSSFQKQEGRWLYIDGTVQAAPQS